MEILLISLALVLFAIAGLQIWRWLDNRHAARVWRSLAAQADASPAEFHPSMVQGLPEPARRFFLFTIAPGSPIRTVAEIEMTGQISLGTKENPNYMPMHARQILAPPQGLVWALDAGQGAMRIQGSDGFDGATSWTRFWLLGTVPVVRAGAGADHARAAFGRVVAEAVFWAPASLLPRNGVEWEALSESLARATVTANGMVQTVDVRIAEDGRPVEVVIPRWTNANPEKIYREQPFGGYLSTFKQFEGYRLPTRVEGGNLVGTEDYFPFYKAEVSAIRFVGGH